MNSQDVEKKFSNFWVEKRPIRGKFSKFCSKRIYRDTDRRVAFTFREIWPTGNRVLYLTKKQYFAGSPSLGTARIAPKIRQGQLPRTFSDCFRFHLNRFIFGGVIPERVNTVKARLKVNPRYGWSLASLSSSQIITVNLVGELHSETWSIVFLMNGVNFWFINYDKAPNSLITLWTKLGNSSSYAFDRDFAFCKAVVPC